MEGFLVQVRELFQKIPKSFYLPIALLVCSTIFFCIGLMQLWGSNAPSAVSAISTQEPQATTSANHEFGLVKVDVEGSVMYPGVYSLPAGSRVQDAVIAAGGLSGSANRDVVAKQINLATKLTDSMKIYIPTSSDEGGQGNVSSENLLGGQVHLIDLNSATAEELDSLPGVGPATSQKIINARPYSNVDELQTKKIVSASVFAKVKNLITTY